MKKIAFVVLMVFGLLATSDSILAGTEYEKALKYYNSKRYKESVGLLKEYAKKKPDPAIYYRIGYALYKLKQFDEAAEYFKGAYLIDPNFSPETIGLTKEQVEKVKAITKTSEEKAPSELSAPETKGVKPEVKKESIPAKQVLAKKETVSVKQPSQPSKEVKPQKPEQQKAATGKKAPQPETKKVEPQKVQPPTPIPALPKPEKVMPGAVPGILAGLFAGFALIILIVWLAIYIFFSLCLFLIAKKLNVSAPWTAWIPLIQLWTTVNAAGKPWWWTLIFLVPIVNAVVFIYLWMCITENLGRNKWLGLLMIVFPISLVWMGILAFSKAEKACGTTTMMDETLTLEKSPVSEEKPPEEEF